MLVELRPFKDITLCCHKIFVAQYVGLIGIRHMLPGRHNHPALNPRALAGDALNQGPKIGVEKHVAILGVVDDVDNLLGKQPWIDGVTNKSRAGRTVVGFHVPVVVPCQGGDAVTALQLPALHRVSQLASACKALTIGIAMTGVISGNRDNLLVTVYPLRVPHNRRNR